jgi:hypothetical protein
VMLSPPAGDPHAGSDRVGFATDCAVHLLASP